MVQVKRKEENSDFKSVTGESIKLVLKRKERIIKIKIINSAYSSTNKRCVVLLITITLNMLSMILHILNLKIVTAIFIVTLLELYRICVTIKEENLMVIKNIGFQVSTKYTLGLKTIFIPWEQVQKIFINDVIYRHKIIYVLNLFTKDTDAKEKLVPLFFNTLPRLACLQLVYKHLKTLGI